MELLQLPQQSEGEQNEHRIYGFASRLGAGRIAWLVDVAQTAA